MFFSFQSSPFRVTVNSTDYLGRFLDDVDRVTSGRPGSISDDRWLVNNYDPRFLPLLDIYLKFSDDRVVSELILLFTDVRERAVSGTVRDLRKRGSERVRMACLGYITAMGEDDDLIPDLFDALEHRDGREFSKAASRMASVARVEDLDRIRRIYGQVTGEMASQIAVIIDSVINRNPSLEPKRDYLMSPPVYPDEEAFDSFLDSAFEYLDVRYRGKVMPRETVSVATFNNVARALAKMRIRLYNEADNLQYYGVDKSDRHAELAALVRVVNSDLSKKRVVSTKTGQSRECPRCGGLMVSYKGLWTCPDCGGNSE